MKKCTCIFIIIVIITILLSINIKADEVIFYTNIVKNGESDKDKVLCTPLNGSFNRSYEFGMISSTESIKEKSYEIVFLAFDNFKQIEFTINSTISDKHYFRIKPNEPLQFPLSINNFETPGIHDLQLAYFFGSDLHDKEKWEFRLVHPYNINRLTFLVDNAKEPPPFEADYYEGQETTFKGLRVLISKSTEDLRWSDGEHLYLEIIDKDQEKLDFNIHLFNGQSTFGDMKVALIGLLDWTQVQMNEREVLFVSVPSGQHITIPVSIPIKMLEKYSDLVVLAIAAPFEPVFAKGTNFDNGEFNEATQIYDCSPRILLVKE